MCVCVCVCVCVHVCVSVCECVCVYVHTRKSTNNFQLCDSLLQLEKKRNKDWQKQFGGVTTKERLWTKVVFVPWGYLVSEYQHTTVAQHAFLNETTCKLDDKQEIRHVLPPPPKLGGTRLGGGPVQCTFFDIGAFTPQQPSICHLSSVICYLSSVTLIGSSQGCV